jgi:hypothetical protein
VAKSKPSDDLGSQFLAGAILVLGFVLYMGFHHGWDKHSWFVPMPFWSGPSDKQIQTKLANDGWPGAEIVDRWSGVESGGDHNIRKGTWLYPVRVKAKADPKSPPVPLDLYVYIDDFGQPQWYFHEPAETR